MQFPNYIQTIAHSKKNMVLKKLIKAVWKAMHLSSYIILFSRNWINPFLTIYVNLKFLPLSQAVKLPIWIYGKTKFLTLNGEFIITAKNVYTGMITIGKSNSAPCTSGGGSEIINYSRIIFEGKTEIGCGCRILTYGKGELIFGKNFMTYNQNVIACCNLIKIGNSVNLGSQCQVFDTDFHFMYNLVSATVRRNNKAIIIGDYCWIGNRTTIMKGTEIPDCTILASNSLLNKKYDIPKGSILAGMPAKVVASDYVRIRNQKIESELSSYFESGGQIYQFPENTNIEYLINRL